MSWRCCSTRWLALGATGRLRLDAATCLLSVGDRLGSQRRKKRALLVVWVWAPQSHGYSRRRLRGWTAQSHFLLLMPADRIPNFIPTFDQSNKQISAASRPPRLPLWLRRRQLLLLSSQEPPCFASPRLGYYRIPTTTDG